MTYKYGYAAKAAKKEKIYKMLVSNFEFDR